jgi:hypothetical protein
MISSSVLFMDPVLLLPGIQDSDILYIKFHSMYKRLTDRWALMYVHFDIALTVRHRCSLQSFGLKFLVTSCEIGIGRSGAATDLLPSSYTSLLLPNHRSLIAPCSFITALFVAPYPWASNTSSHHRAFSWGFHLWSCHCLIIRYVSLNHFRHPISISHLGNGLPRISAPCNQIPNKYEIMCHTFSEGQIITRHVLCNLVYFSGLNINIVANSFPSALSSRRALAS